MTGDNRRQKEWKERRSGNTDLRLGEEGSDRRGMNGAGMYLCTVCYNPEIHM